ncbi:MAG: hypothetical protein DRJ40_08175 [Thermoprotei archaeon]|nr:MAG: hypothetical protein DRJ40_08175 [Thermoprotei archaeon]
MLTRVLVTALNGFTFVFLLIVAMFFATMTSPEAPLLAVLVLLSSVDALDDVARSVTGRSLIPVEKSIYRLANYVFESISGIVGMAMVLYGMLYIHYFTIPFWFGVILAGTMMVVTAIYDMFKLRYGRKVVSVRAVKYL